MQKILHPSRGLIAVLAIAAAAIPFILYAQGSTPIVLTVAFQELLVQAAYLSACFLIGRPILRWVAPGRVDSVGGVASAITLGLGIVGFATLALGLAGLLSTSTAWGIVLGVAILGLIDGKHLLASLSTGTKRLKPWLNQPSEGGWIWLIAACLLAIPVIGATLPAGLLWRPDDPHPYDSLIYHLQVPREWFELGRIVPLEHNVYSYFPFNVEVHYLLASYLRGSPWLAVYQDQFLSISFTLLSAAALWGWLRTRVEPQMASLATAAFLCVPWLLMLGCITYVENGMLLFSVLAITWCIDAITATDRPYRQFMLAGVFAGLASGTKFTGIAMVMLAVPAAAIICFALPTLRTGRLKQLILGSILFGFAGLVALSPWLLRNQVWVGNLVFPNAMRQLGQAHFSDTQVERWERAHGAAADYSTLSARLQRVTGEIAINWRFSYVFFPLAIAGALLAWRKPEAWMLLLLILLMLVFWIAATHLMGRFFTLALAPGAILIALLPRRAFHPCCILVAAAGILTWIGPTVHAPAPEEAATRNVHALLDPFAKAGREGAYGLQDYSIFDEKVGPKLEFAKFALFVGDGQMFQRTFPMSKIRYRTVFDLNPAGRNVVDTYYGPPPETCPKDALIVVNPPEANRLSKTYYGAPGVQPSDLEGYSNIIIEP